MNRTISLKLDIFEEQSKALFQTQFEFSKACNLIVPFAAENRCWNRVGLHHLAYYSVRKSVPDIGSQLVCNAIQKVCGSFKALKPKKSESVPNVSYKESISIHYCKRTYSIKDDRVSLFTVKGRIRCKIIGGEFQLNYLSEGRPKEAELIRKGKQWFLNIVLDLPDVPAKKREGVLGVDLGENNLATTSKGTIHGGGKLRHKRDKFLSRRRKLQSNGSKASKRCLKKISGREKRHVKQTNHLVSKAIVKEAVEFGVGYIVLEDLKNIRKRIKGNKRIRSRLHRWSWYQLQHFIEYKAQTEGIEILQVHPAYTSLSCSHCSSLGSRLKNRFKCSNCGSYQHSDRNAAVNILKLGESVVSSTAPVNVPMVVAC